MNKRIGLVGLGRWGRIWARVLDELGILYWVVDKNPNRVDEFLVENPDLGLYFYDHEAVNKQADGVIIATPPDTHVELARYFIEQGTPVLIEKPVATSPQGVEDIADCAWENNVPVLEGHTFLHDPTVQAALCLAKARFTRIDELYLNWSQNSVRSGRAIDVFDNLGPHPLSIVASFAPEDIVSFEVKDTVMEDGLIQDALCEIETMHMDITLRLSHRRFKRRFFHVIGDSGKIFVDPTCDRIEWSPDTEESNFDHTWTIDGPEPLKNEAKYFMDLFPQAFDERMLDVGWWVADVIQKLKFTAYGN